MRERASKLLPSGPQDALTALSPSCPIQTIDQAPGTPVLRVRDDFSRVRILADPGDASVDLREAPWLFPGEIICDPEPQESWLDDARIASKHTP